jgi:Carbohydrate family 9 binding domain-like
MAISAGEAVQRPVRRRWRLRITVLGLLVLVALTAVALQFYRKYVQKVVERPTIVAVYRKALPVADGVIGPKEYGLPLNINWTADNTLAAFDHQVTGDSTENKTPSDLTIKLYAAYSDTSLFLAFQVRDQFVDAQEADRTTPHQNDGVEVFIDGDRVPNDFSTMTQADPAQTKILPSEGFQLLADAAGHQYTRAQAFSDADWKAAAKRTDDGYIIEIEIPLALIDTQDGPGVTLAGPGSVLNFALAVTDNDEEVRDQKSYAYLRTSTQTTSPWIGGERAWNFAIELEPKWSLLPW